MSRVYYSTNVLLIKVHLMIKMLQIARSDYTSTFR
jgi:hypothetical protein